MNPYSIALVGESCSGKSSIIKSFLTKTPTLIPNTGTEAGATTITLKNNKQVQIYFYDTFFLLWLSTVYENMQSYCYCI